MKNFDGLWYMLVGGPYDEHLYFQKTAIEETPHIKTVDGFSGKYVRGSDKMTLVWRSDVPES